MSSRTLYDASTGDGIFKVEPLRTFRTRVAGDEEKRDIVRALSAANCVRRSRSHAAGDAVATRLARVGVCVHQRVKIERILNCVEYPDNSQPSG